MRQRSSELGLDDLPALALFAHVVRLRSFTAAGAHAGIAKSAVSRRVAALESRLGVRLLQRSTRRLALTPEGARVYEHAARLVDAAGAAGDAVGDAASDPRGTLRVSAPVTFTQMHLAPAVAVFLADHPGIELQLDTNDRFVDVVDGGFDVVIRIARLRDSSLVARRLATDRMVAVAAPAYLARHGTPEVPADLVGHNCLRYALLPTASEWRFAGPRGEMAVPVQGNFVATDGTVLREAAVAGMGVAVLPSFMAAPDVAAGRLQVVLQPWCRSDVGIWALLAHRRHLPARVRRFVEFLVARFAGARLGVPPAPVRSAAARRRPAPRSTRA